MASGPAARTAGTGRLRVCVFGSSSSRTKERYLEEARTLGRLLAERGHVCVNGAGRFGGMGALNDGALAAGGTVEGVIHKMWMPKGGKKDELQGGLTSLLIGTSDACTAKENAGDTPDCFVAFPGPGTKDEMEVISERQLELSGKCPRPVVL